MLGRRLMGDSGAKVVALPVPAHSSATPRGKPSSLSQALEAYLTRSEPVRIGGEYIHAGSLFELCSRQQVLAKGKQVTEVIRAPLRVTFDIGSAMHDWVRDRYLGPLGRLWGDWVCVKCGKVTSGLWPSSCTCGGRVRYRERVFRDEQLKLVGSLDGMEKDPAMDGLGVLELKSIDGGRFKVLREPMAEHAFRSSVYCHLAKLSWFRILYISKSLEPKSPFKEFVGRYDPRVMEQVRAKLAELREGGKRVCKSSGDLRAVSCPQRTVCFGVP